MNSRAVFFGFSFRHHGAHTAFRGLARALADQLVLDVSPPWPRRIPHALEWRLNWRWLYLSEYRLLPHYRARDRRVIHHYFSENTMFRAHRWKRHHRLVATCHQPLERILTEDGDPRRAMYRAALEACDAVIVQTTGDVESFASALKIPRPTYIPLGVDCDFFTPPAEPIPTERPMILTVGNWLRDYAVWAETVRRMLDAGIDAEFVVVANRDTLAEARRLLGASTAAVRFMHGISDEALLDLYRRAAVFFLPLQNAMGNDALLEGLATGRAMVLTDLSATRDYAGDAAVYIPSGSPEAAACALRNLLEHDETRTRLGRAARERARDRFDWPRLAELHRALYRSMLDSNL